MNYSTDWYVCLHQARRLILSEKVSDDALRLMPLLIERGMAMKDREFWVSVAQEFTWAEIISPAKLAQILTELERKRVIRQEQSGRNRRLEIRPIEEWKTGRTPGNRAQVLGAWRRMIRLNGVEIGAIQYNWSTIVGSTLGDLCRPTKLVGHTLHVVCSDETVVGEVSRRAGLTKARLDAQFLEIRKLSPFIGPVRGPSE